MSDKKIENEKKETEVTEENLLSSFVSNRAYPLSIRHVVKRKLTDTYFHETYLPGKYLMAKVAEELTSGDKIELLPEVSWTVFAKILKDMYGYNYKQTDVIVRGGMINGRNAFAKMLKAIKGTTHTVEGMIILALVMRTGAVQDNRYRIQFKHKLVKDKNNPKLAFDIDAVRLNNFNLLNGILQTMYDKAKFNFKVGPNNDIPVEHLSHAMGDFRYDINKELRTIKRGLELIEPAIKYARILASKNPKVLAINSDFDLEAVVGHSPLVKWFKDTDVPLWYDASMSLESLMHDNVFNKHYKNDAAREAAINDNKAQDFFKTNFRKLKDFTTHQEIVVKILDQLYDKTSVYDVRGHFKVESFDAHSQAFRRVVKFYTTKDSGQQSYVCAETTKKMNEDSANDANKTKDADGNLIDALYDGNSNVLELTEVESIVKPLNFIRHFTMNVDSQSSEYLVSIEELCSLQGTDLKAYMRTNDYIDYESLLDIRNNTKHPLKLNTFTHVKDLATRRFEMELETNTNTQRGQTISTNLIELNLPIVASAFLTFSERDGEIEYEFHSVIPHLNVGIDLSEFTKQRKAKKLEAAFIEELIHGVMSRDGINIYKYRTNDLNIALKYLDYGGLDGLDRKPIIRKDNVVLPILMDSSTSAVDAIFNDMNLHGKCFLERDLHYIDNYCMILRRDFAAARGISKISEIRCSKNKFDDWKIKDLLMHFKFIDHEDFRYVLQAFDNFNRKVMDYTFSKYMDKLDSSNSVDKYAYTELVNEYVQPMAQFLNQRLSIVELLSPNKITATLRNSVGYKKACLSLLREFLKSMNIDLPSEYDKFIDYNHIHVWVGLKS